MRLCGDNWVERAKASSIMSRHLKSVVCCNTENIIIKGQLVSEASCWEPERKRSIVDIHVSMGTSKRAGVHAKNMKGYDPTKAQWIDE